MAAINHKKDYGPFANGLNSRFLPASLMDSEVSVCQNAQFNNNGSIEKYPGYIKDGSPFPNAAASFIRTIFDFKRGSSTDNLLIAAADAGNTNATYKVDIKSTIGDGTYQYVTFGIGTAAFTNGNTTVTGTLTSWTKELQAGDKIKLASDTDDKYTEIATVGGDTSITLVGGGYLGTTHTAAAYLARKIFSKNNVPRFCPFNNLALMVDGEHIPQSYDGTNLISMINSYSGTTITVGANPAPVGKYIISHKNRVFMAENSNIHWCAANNQTAWDPAAQEPIFPQDGGDIVSFLSFADSIFVFKSNGKVYRVWGNFDDSVIGTVAYITKVDYSENIGIIGDRSPFVHNNILYFLAETGVYSIDGRGFMQRVSFYIEPTTQTFNFTTGAQGAKNYPFTTKAQWDAGTHTGTHALGSGVVESFFDEHKETDALQGYSKAAIAIGTDNVVHCAYIPAANTDRITYIRYDVDGTVTKENVGVSATTNYFVTIGVSPADQSVGIVYQNGASFKYIERTPLVTGVWGAETNIITTYQPIAASLQFSSGGIPCVAMTGAGGADNASLYYAQRTGGVWPAPINTVSSILTSGFATKDYMVSLSLDPTDNIYIVFKAGAPTLFRAYKSTNGGTTFALTEAYTPVTAQDSESCLASAIDNSSHHISVYSNGTNIVRRDHTAASSSNLDATTTNPLCRGYFTFYDTPLTTQESYLNNVWGNSPNQAEKFTFETNVLSNTANVVSKTAGARPACNPFVVNNRTTAMVCFGVNANELIIRRISFLGNWTGPENHDSTLSAWGTYDVTGQVSNGNTLQTQIALASSSPASSFSNINSGQVISSNIALTYNKPKFYFILTVWAGVQVSSIVLNYTGAGIDARQAFGISFYNEAYFAISQAGQSTNNLVLISDIKNAYTTATYAVNCMERFKTKLYAGSSTNGDLYILKQTQAFNNSSYNMDVQTREDFMGFIFLPKDFYKIYGTFVVQAAGSFVFSYRFDNFAVNGGSSWVNTTVDMTKNGYFEVPLGGTNAGIPARSIQYRIQNNNAGETVQILGFTITHGLLTIR